MERDFWDGKNRKPKVTHGNILVQKCDFKDFKDFIKALSKYAFKNNNFPLILSLELHCCAFQRDIIANYIYTNFKNRLFIPDSESILNIFSTNDLLGKVLIKNSVRYPTDFYIADFGIKDDNLVRLSSLFKEKFPLNDLKGENKVMKFKTPFFRNGLRVIRMYENDLFNNHFFFIKFEF